MVWRGFRGVDPVDVNTAYRDYLRLHDLDGYAAVCDPSQFTFGAVNFSGGMALTPDCAQLQVAVAVDVAAWIAAGQPQR